MLINLNINNFIIIDNLNIDFNNGLNVLTGDTGAGKSIIIDALSIIKGNKFDKESIKENCTYSSIQATFNIENDINIKEYLIQENIKHDNTITIYRYIDNKSNKILLNNKPIKLNILNKLLDKQLNIINQKDTDKVLKEKNHINILDNYINDNTLINDINILYNDFIKLKKQYNELLIKLKDENYIDFLINQLDELNKLELNEDEYNTLKQKDNEYKINEKNIKKYKESLLYLNQDNGIKSNIYLINNLLNEDPIFKDIILNINLNIEELIDKLDTIIIDNNIDYNEYNNIQERLYDLNNIIKKYGSINTAIKKREELNNLILLLTNKDTMLKELLDKVNNSYNIYLDKALLIHNKRIKYAKILEDKVNKELNNLCINDSIFRISINKSNDTNNGYDNVIFSIATNGTSIYNSIDKVLSGGEFSRIMLIIQDILIQSFDIKCVVFDEIDTGISGTIANKVGEKLYDISKDRQIFVITHLAVVASYSNNHYKISKNNNCTNIKLLNEKDIIEELSIMNFSKSNKESLSASKILRNNAQIYQNNH